MLYWGSNSVPKTEKRYVSLESPTTSFSSWITALIGKTGSDDNITERTAMGLSAVWRAAQILKESIATPELNVYKRDENGDITIAHQHPVQKLLNREPSSLYSSFTLRETMMHHLCYWGNAFAKINYGTSGASPREIQLIHPANVGEVTYASEGTLQYHINGYDRPIPGDQMIHISWVSDTGLFGENPIRMHMNTLNTDRSSRDFAEKFYENGAHIKGVVTHPGKLSAEAYTRLKQSWEASYSGTKNAGKTAILEEGASFTPTALSPSDAQWLGTRQNVVSEVSRIYGVPNHMLQDLERATFNNIEHMGLEFIKFTWTPWVRRWESELNRKMFTKREKFKYFVRIDLSGLLRGDLETMSEYYQTLFNIGAMNQNEIRRALSLNSVPFGDRYYIQGNNMIPTDKVDELTANGQGFNANNKQLKPKIDEEE